MAVREGRGAKRERGRDGGLERGRRQGDILTGGVQFRERGNERVRRWKGGKERKRINCQLIAVIFGSDFGVILDTYFKGHISTILDK